MEAARHETRCDDASASFGPILKFAWFAMSRVMLPRRLGALAARSTRLTRAASTLAPPDPNVDFESFAFGLNDVRTEWMWHATFDAASGEWSKGGLVPHGPLQLEPSATVLNYGQCIFEGLKAFRQPDGGIGIFRPDMNAARFGEGAARMLMPQVPAETFVAACEAVVAANAHWTPPHKGGTLYLRPLLFGSGAALGVAPSPQTTFCVYSSPVGNYFKGGVGEAPPITLEVSSAYRRATPGGAGSTKAAGNYAPTFVASKECKGRGHSEVLFVDALTSSVIEEAGASNFFAVLPCDGGLELVTPPLDASTILPGVTRSSVLTLARDELVHAGLGLTKVSERPIHLDELAKWSEAFCTGTGASIASVGQVTVPTGVGAKPAEYKTAGWGAVTKAVAQRLFAIQWGECEGEQSRGWMHAVRPR